MNRFVAALAVLLAKDTSRALSLIEPRHWQDDTFAEVPKDQDGAAVMGLSAVWACVNLLMGTTASLPLLVYATQSDGGRKVARDHWLYRLLHDSPNSQQTALDFWEFMAGSIELWGNAYARKVRSGDRIISLVPVAPQLPNVRNIANGRLGYRWSENGQSYNLSSDDVFHIRGPGGNPLGGMSALTFGAKTFGLAGAINQAAAATFRNGLRPGVIISFKEFLSAERRAEVHAALQERYQGAMNAGRPFVAEGGQTVSTLTMNPEDAQMLESRGFSVEEICRFFGVPPFMIGHTDKSSSWGTGIEQMTLGFVKFALRRRLKRIEQAIEKQLLTPADRAAGIVVEFSLEGLLRGDSTGRAEFYGKMTQIGAMTINEVRQLEKLPPVEGGDVPRMQSQNVPITQPMASSALPTPQE